MCHTETGDEHGDNARKFATFTHQVTQIGKHDHHGGFLNRVGVHVNMLQNERAQEANKASETNTFEAKAKKVDNHFANVTPSEQALVI